MIINKIVVGITQGDINGISYEVVIKTLMDPRIMDFCIPVVYGSPKVAAYHRKALKIDNFSFNNIRTPSDANPKRPNIINCLDDSIRVELGKSTEMAGQASLASLKGAVADLKKGDLDVLVTAPINKNNIQIPDFSFPGHTEFLASEFGEGKDPLMFMVGEFLKIGVVTGHIPLSQVVNSITGDLIIQKLRIMHDTLLKDFGIRKPKIAVLGLNPHSGDKGLLGSDEKETIEPALLEARKNNILALGPFAADGFFGSSSYKHFDAVLAMYHDQGLAPFKALDFSGVNFTAGLPVIRTSPDHGTGYDIAGKGIASPNSFRNALFMALDIFRHRKEYNELSANPLEVNEMDKNHNN